MTNRTNSNFYQIAKTDTNGNVVGLQNVSIANLSITGGNPGQVLTTDGAGTLTWGPGGGGGTALQPQIEWAATVGSGTTYTDANLATFIDGTYAAVYVNGVLLTTAEYTITGTTLTINNALIGGETVTVGPAGAGGTVTSIATTQVDSSALGFTLTGGPITTTGTVTLNVPSANTLKTALNINGYPALNGNGQYYLSGDGTWQPTIAIRSYLMAHGGKLQPGIYPANTAIVFSRVEVSNGGIAYNTTTGVLTLPAGSVYRLTATLQSSVNSSQFASGDITFIWQHAGNSQPVYANTETFADSYAGGSTFITTQATNEIIVAPTAVMTLKVAMFYPMNAALYDVNYVRLIAQQL